MPYAILRFAKRKDGAVSAVGRHIERKKEDYKSNPDIDIGRSCNYDFYIDDGYSGTNFNRPSFQRMIVDIEDGKISCVITKDLSRLVRNYLESGAYIEVFFPKHKVCYIAVNDGVDSMSASGLDITPFKNILNEIVAYRMVNSKYTKVKPTAVLSTSKTNSIE